MVQTSALYLYALALGSNRALSAKHPPERMVREAATLIGQLGEVRAMAPVLITRPLGPSQRLFANSALLVASPLPPEAMLAGLKQIESRLGRQRHRRWGARRMDIDIILWSGGIWNSRTLTIPHLAFRSRSFVLRPLRAIAPTWRDPVSGLSVRQLDARLRKATAPPRPRG